MTPTGEHALRAAVRALSVCRSAEARALAGVVATVLVAEGLLPEPVPGSDEVTPGAKRQRRYREELERKRHLLRNGDASRDGITEGGVGGGASSILPFFQKSLAAPPSQDRGGVGGEVTRNGDASRDVTEEPRPTHGDLPRLIDPKLELDSESRAFAEQQSVTDIATEWQTFKDRSIRDARTASDWKAAWRAACPKIAKIQKSDRQRDAQKASGPNGKPPEPPEAVRARERSRDGEAERYGRQAVRAPVNLSSLLDKARQANAKRVAPATEPAPAIDLELTDDEREQRRQEQLAELEQFEDQAHAGELEEP